MPATEHDTRGKTHHPSYKGKMLRFDVYRDGAIAKDVNLAGAYVFGPDGVPVRADITASDGQITCIKQSTGPVGIALLWDTGNSGSFLLPTTRLEERNTPYNLSVELARAQIMTLFQKREEWGLFDYADAKELNKEFGNVRTQFVQAISQTDPITASLLADSALDNAVMLGEKMALLHASAFLKRKRGKRTPIGTILNVNASSKGYKSRAQEVADFYSIPMPWKSIEPKERDLQYAVTDEWINTAIHARKQIHAGPLLSFDSSNLPEWMYIWEHDYEALRDTIYEHVERVVTRYAKQVQVWNVVSGIHALNTFNLTFDQLMELTRMNCMLVRRLAPNAKIMIELTMPWGEYYAHNQRTIPPLMYAEMAVQSGVQFDAFGLRVIMGVPREGHFVRNLLQCSSMMDQFVTFAKTIHITACEVPSQTAIDKRDVWQGEAPITQAGRWHAEWSQRLQAEWLQAFSRIAMSKPFMESICWRTLADHNGQIIPHAGLCHGNTKPKLAYREMRNFRAMLATEAHAAANRPADPNEADLPD